ncbi:MAG: acylphosphatase [Candidatus Eisenbacteria sp.]|nr:acylphosphatase [Candidatus Eisenbacteria bacterium]
MGQFRAVVHGRVQGVCFRMETVSTARNLGLRGFARNLPDGSVEVVANGDQGTLESLLDFLHYGPTLAKVDHLEVDWKDASPVGEPFEVRY